jgi:hypothetical protein
MLRRSRRVPVILGVCLLGALSGVDGAEPLRLQVTPVAALAPAFVTVRASIEADAENRGLQVVAASSDFYRSSQVEIDGAQAPRLSVFEFRNLPAGDYEFTAILTGTHGPRATVFRFAKVVPLGGSVR